MENLPPELVLQIAGSLSGPDLVALSGTNRAFSRMLSHERRLWRHHLDDLKYPSSSNLNEASEDSTSCSEKDEFISQSRLRQNWRSGKFRTGESTHQMTGQWILGYSYADFIVWHSSLGEPNSWRLCCCDATTEKFIFANISYPAQANMEDCTIGRIQMATKTLAILHLFDLADQFWAIDISDPQNPITIWQSQLSLPNEVWIMQVVNSQVLLSRSASIPSIEIFDASNGNFITRVDFPIVTEPNMDFGFFFDGRRCNLEVEQELKMMPIYSKDDSPLNFLRLKDHQIISLDPPISMNWIEEFSFLGPTAFMVGNIHTNIYKIISWKDDLIVREFQPSHGQTNPGLALEFYEPSGVLYVVKKNSSGHCATFRRFDKGGAETQIKIGSRNLKPRTSHLHHDTLVSHSTFNKTRRLHFVSFSSNGEIREVMRKPFQNSPLRRFKLEEIWCLSTVAVAKFSQRRGSRKTIFAVLSFKPE